MIKEATLCLLIRENQDGKELLLAMKKRGFGAGKWNGVGGKPDLRKGDKNITETAIRETEEEIGVKIKKLEKVAVLNFRFPYIPEEKEWDQNVHVFLAREWEGTPIETEEMRPQWFRIPDIPYASMWKPDAIWLPYVLSGKRIKGRFVFSPDGEGVAENEITVIE